ncbi:hypothetical protein DFH09DRAFT_1184518 [Mycena vulgaris]|nr:hypothetical protein DFH09DRAFT_1184518 [Mycena vulgaris]
MWRKIVRLHGASTVATLWEPMLFFLLVLRSQCPGLLSGFPFATFVNFIAELLLQ